MEKFSFGTFLLGAFITIISAIFVGFHQKVADSLGDGVSDYQSYKKWGLVALGIGIVIMLNLHRFLLGMFIETFFKIGR